MSLWRFPFFLTWIANMLKQRKLISWPCVVKHRRLYSVITHSSSVLYVNVHRTKPSSNIWDKSVIQVSFKGNTMVMTSKLCTQRCSFLSPTRERKQLEHVCHLFQYNTRVLAHLCVCLRTSVQLKLSETATKKKLRLWWAIVVQWVMYGLSVSVWLCLDNNNTCLGSEKYGWVLR